jgi:DNA-binding response OmpR family regulator
MEKSRGQTQLKAILVVDDDEQLAAVAGILADEKFLVDVALDGEEASRLCTSA